jgi:hypothetical protein
LKYGKAIKWGVFYQAFGRNYQNRERLRDHLKSIAKGRFCPARKEDAMLKTTVAATMLSVAAVALQPAAAQTGSFDAYQQAAARCRLFANNSNSGFFAYGDPLGVMQQQIMNDFANAARARANYRDCMIAQGFSG